MVCLVGRQKEVWVGTLFLASRVLWLSLVLPVYRGPDDDVLAVQRTLNFEIGLFQLVCWIHVFTISIVSDGL